MLANGPQLPESLTLLASGVQKVAIPGKAFMVNSLINSFFSTFQVKCLYIGEKNSQYKLLILKMKARVYRLEALGF